MLNEELIKLLLLCNTALNLNHPCQLFHNLCSMDNPAQAHPTTPTNSQNESLPDIDDSRDSSYAEPPAANAAKITPLQRKGIAEEFSTAAKKRVDKVDGHQGRCIVTNTPEFNCVQYAHLLPRAATPELVSHHTMLCFLVQLRH